jgi:hypothetical protein
MTSILFGAHTEVAIGIWYEPVYHFSQLAQVLTMSVGVLNLYSLVRIREKRGTAWAFYLPDGLGSIRQATDGAVTSSRRWTPFGPALSEAEGVEVGTAQAG